MCGLINIYKQNIELGVSDTHNILKVRISSSVLLVSNVSVRKVRGIEATAELNSK